LKAGGHTIASADQEELCQKSKGAPTADDDTKRMLSTLLKDLTKASQYMLLGASKDLKANKWAFPSSLLQKRAEGTAQIQVEDPTFLGADTPTNLAAIDLPFLIQRGGENDCASADDCASSSCPGSLCVKAMHVQGCPCSSGMRTECGGDADSELTTAPPSPSEVNSLEVTGDGHVDGV
jgi:hypothetical protein